MLDTRLTLMQERLNSLESNKDMDSAKDAIRAVVGLLVSNSDELDFRLFRDGDGKLTANASWFFHDEEIADRRATYAFDVPSDYNLDVKVFGVVKPSMRTISWAVGLTPNFEDEPFNGVFNVGIDFFVPESKDRIILALSKNYVIRTIELKGQLTATFLEIFSSWLKIGETSSKAEFHALLWNSLDLHPINKRFYEGISQRFITLRQHLETSGALDSHHSAQFANRLIGRVIFTWFLDKKSLLNAEAEYFSSTLFEDDTVYYRQKLEPLFFEVLNTPVGERIVSDLLTPYLNGGLFEPKKDDLYKSDNLTFPRNYFDDLFDFLRAYNFTTDESTSDFQQVAIDPEMLGRIFENLLAEVSEETGEQARKAKGAFYTPREIVDFMCKEALKSYLRSKFPNDPNFDSRIYQLVDATERQFQDQDHNWRRDLKPYKDQIIDALDNLKVFDPACGSGAFPIGMMQLLVRVYARLEPRFDSHKAKLAIVEKNIYGADIEPMAVEISRLRAWLSLVVELDSRQKEVSPLPNLDFKFVAANSLVGLAKMEQLVFFEDDNLDHKLQELRLRYFSTKSLPQKASLREKYLSLVTQETALWGESTRTSQLKGFRPFEADSVSPFFDPKHMFGLEKFHIIIGNPPYIDYRKIPAETKAELRTYRIANHSKQISLYLYFFELGLKLASRGGVVAYITPQQYLSYPNAKGLRDLISENRLVQLADFARVKVFDASTYTFVTIISKEKPSGIFGYSEYAQTDDLNSPVKRLEFDNPLPETFDVSDFSSLLRKLDSHAVSTLGDVSHIFCASSSTSIEVSNEDNLGPRFLEAKEIFPYHVQPGRKFVSRGSYSASSAQKQIGPRIYTSRMTKVIRAALVEDNEMLGGKVNVVLPNKPETIQELLALLNSKIANFWIREKFSMQHMQGGALPLNTPELRALPVPTTTQRSEEIRGLVARAGESQADELIEIQEQIDKIFFEAFNLTAEEVALIEHRFTEYGIKVKKRD